MKTEELIRLINLHDPRHETTIRLEVMKLVGGIGSAYARCPTIEHLWRGIDWGLRKSYTPSFYKTLCKK